MWREKIMEKQSPPLRKRSRFAKWDMFGRDKMMMSPDEWSLIRNRLLLRECHYRHIIPTFAIKGDTHH